MVMMAAVMIPLSATHILRDISQLISTCCNYVSNYCESHIMKAVDALMNDLHKVFQCVYKGEENCLLELLGKPLFSITASRFKKKG